MNVSLKLGRNTANKPLELHFLPAKIFEDGTTDVDNYFNSYTRKGLDGILINAVRGFPLKGEILKSPSNYRAFVLQSSEKHSEAKVIHNMYISGKFDNFTYWNYDKVPSKADTYKQALQMLDISKELCAPVLDSEILIEIDGMGLVIGGQENTI
ncbi:uncharacterized protein LOC101456914 [Ceratitis capitata]|uniref:uncharacterized protein LOC101456914 n=1 Tax=Ceratitis capitata TaxID=7213 RepID=UPI00032A01CA|nr:uncharacterized protein LOC101456914 [Ceratitis capitata]